MFRKQIKLKSTAFVAYVNYNLSFHFSLKKSSTAINVLKIILVWDKTHLLFYSFISYIKIYIQFYNFIVMTI